MGEMGRENPQEGGLTARVGEAGLGQPPRCRPGTTWPYINSEPTQEARQEG